MTVSGTAPASRHVMKLPPQSDPAARAAWTARARALFNLDEAVTRS